MLGFVRVTTKYPQLDTGILTCFPFGRQNNPRKILVKKQLSHTLGSINPCPITVHMGPLPARYSKFMFEYLLLPPRSATSAMSH